MKEKYEKKIILIGLRIIRVLLDYLRKIVLKFDSWYLPRVYSGTYREIEKLIVILMVRIKSYKKPVLSMEDKDNGSK